MVHPLFDFEQASRPHESLLKSKAGIQVSWFQGSGFLGVTHTQHKHNLNHNYDCD